MTARDSTQAEAKSALFISYDGLTDPLGGSQILPYLRGIAGHPRHLHVLSFEKPDRYAASGDSLRAELEDVGIGWTPLTFTKGGKLAKLWDQTRMYAFAIALARRDRFGIVHCRGHLAAQVGDVLKLLFGTRFLFDFRGLWVDERVDKRGWDLSRFSDRVAYRFFKRLERRLLRRADQIVALTRAVKPLLESMGATTKRVTVIPCCADFDHFQLPNQAAKNQTRRRLGLPDAGIVLGYLGSVGPMYMSSEILKFSEIAISAGTAVALLCITPDTDLFHHELDRRKWAERGLSHAVVRAARSEVPGLLAGVDVLISFIKPTSTRIGTSPTKMAECFAQGIPIVGNPGIGDVQELMEYLGGGILVDPADAAATASAVAALPEVVAQGGKRLRDVSRPILGLEHANERYWHVYQSLEK